MLNEKLKNKELILASGSPRRQHLLMEIGVDFTVELKDDILETYPSNLKNEQIAIYLAEIKADAYTDIIGENTILITADTIVLLNDNVINKPADYNDAVIMLQKLSGVMHTVITGVCIRSKNKTKTFFAETNVFFKQLSDEEITFYIDNYRPYDKAGAYGIQEWIGYIAIERIEGSFYNVMGLPVQKLYNELLTFIED
ncbi:MAG: Maf family nucleotide pyrophosphatase [Bacteroidota bacterium]